MEIEIWNPVVSFENLYEVSNMGNVRKIGGKQLSVELNVHRAYPTVGLYKNHKAYSRSVHRLVLEAFVGPCPNGLEAAHLNGKRKDNRLSNLKWVTRKENHSHKWLHGTAQVGDQASNNRFKSAQIYTMRVLHSFGAKLCEIGSIFNETPENLHNCIHNNSWKHLKDPTAKLIEENLELQEENKRLREALSNKALNIDIAGMRSGCWCQIIIGKPLIKEHTDNCKLASKVLEGK